jgi:hypothetical protein
MAAGHHRHRHRHRYRLSLPLAMGLSRVLPLLAAASAVATSPGPSVAEARRLSEPAAGTAVTVTWDNSQPRHDAQGEIMDAHDGNIIGPIGGRYYLYAIGYGLYSEQGHVRSNGGGCAAHCSGCSAHCSGACTASAPGVALCPGAPDQSKCDTTAGFRLDHNVSVWSSSTTASGSWKLETQMALPIKSRPAAVYFRPKVQYNNRTKLYVLWVNYQPGGFGSGGHYLTATSSTPVGPFTIVPGQEDIKMDAWQGNHGDFHYFVDDDENATAYIVYTVYGGPGGPGGHKGTTMSVQRLNDAYTGPWMNHSAAATPGASGSNGSSAIFPTDPKVGAPNDAESPSIFKWAGYYYMLSTHVCCFCRHGGGVSGMQNMALSSFCMKKI